MHRIRQNLEQFGLGVTQHMMDAMKPGAGADNLVECAREGAQCLPIPPCAAAVRTSSTIVVVGCVCVYVSLSRSLSPPPPPPLSQTHIGLVCAWQDGTYTVLYGKQDRRTVTMTGLTLPVKCNVGTFKADPVPGTLNPKL